MVLTTISQAALHSILDIFQCFLLTSQNVLLSCFTFHSGYIPIKPLSLMIVIPLFFTFHSGYIPINQGEAGKDRIQIFTFHSGYIPILPAIVRDLSILAFTFHSGYIPIPSIPTMLFLLKNLYIPFWIYSNTLQDDTGEQSITFTFHSGYIPMLTLTSCIISIPTLHSILDIFQ